MVEKSKNALHFANPKAQYLKYKEEIDVAIQNISNKKSIKVNGKIKNEILKNIVFLRAIDSKNGKKIQAICRRS